MQNHSLALANEPVKTLLWKLSVPAMAGMFVMSLYNVVDMIFVGRGVGALAIAGVSVVFPLQMFTMAIGMMIGMGTSSLISRSMGAGDMKRAERALGNAIFLILILGSTLTIVGLAKTTFFIYLFGATDDVFPYAKEYMDVILFSVVLHEFAMSSNGIIRAEGNARVAMVSMFIGALVNIALDPIFIFALGMGVRGAAIATVIAQAVTTLYLLRYFLSGKSSLRIRVKNFLLEWAVVKQIVSIGFASFIRTAATSFIAVIINRTLASYGGGISIAVFGVIRRVMMFAAMPSMGIAQGLQPILGFSYGAKRYDRGIEVIRKSAIIATVFSVAAFGILLFFPGPIMRIFSTDAVLLSQGTHAMKLAFLAFWLVGFHMVGSTIFQAIGKVIPTFILATSRQILFLIPLILILPRFFQLDGIWLSIPIADALSFSITLVMVIPQMREFKRQQALIEEGDVICTNH
ncbi:MAG: MATE family efflux transporter [Dehalococcoidia bacterium]|nr:MATE family efflux transporter [Dehalococcoidia bacterium]